MLRRRSVDVFFDLTTFGCSSGGICGVPHAHSSALQLIVAAALTNTDL
jgi:hypothetical protein